MKSKPAFDRKAKAEARPPKETRIGLIRLLSAPRVLRKHLAQAHPNYWRLRNGWQRFAFTIARGIWNVRIGGRNAKERAALGFVFTRAIAGQLAVSCLLVVGLWILDGALVQRLFWMGLERFIVPVPTADLFHSLATALAGVGGAFLGLYFTALSVVASTSYRDVPDDVRMAALNERMGGFYLAVVTSLTAIAVVLAAALSLGMRPGVLNFALLSLLGVGSVLTFVPLGKRAFMFLDPVRLGDVLGKNILDNAKLAGSAKHRRDDTSFQLAYYRSASQSLATLQHVVEVSLRETHKGATSLRSVGTSIAHLFAAYAALKRQIPANSLWFPRRPQFRSWLTAEVSHVQVAVQASMPIHPRVVPNHQWIETRLATMIASTVTELLDQHDYTEAYAVLDVALSVVEQLAYEHRFQEGLILSRVLAGTRLPPNTERDASLDSVSRRAAFDMGRRGVVCLTVGLARAAGEATVARVEAWARATVNRVDDARVPMGPELVRERMLFLQKSSEFERISEGKDVTPEWFKSYFIAGAYLEYFNASVAIILDAINNQYVNEATSLLPERPEEALQLVQIGLETCTKLVHCLSVVAQVPEVLRPLDRPIGDHTWVGIDEEAARKVENLRDELVMLLVALVPTLPQVFEADQRPDDLGYAYVVVAEEALREMLSTKEGSADLFGPYFVLALAAYDRVRHDVAGLPDRTKLAFASDILTDICEVSGYAMILHDLGCEKPWKAVQAVWQKWLEQQESPDQFCKQILGLLGFADSLLFTVTPRSILRGGWKRMFTEAALARGATIRPRFGYFEDIKPSAGGPLAEAYFESPLSNAHDVFIGCYLANHPLCHGDTVPRAAQEFTKRVAWIAKERTKKEQPSEPTD